jgi:hypothetical protein
MGFYDGSKIITDGLVLSLDAADLNSYPGSGTVWNDLSGNSNNCTLVNSPTFTSANQGNFLLNGSNQNITVPITSIPTGNQISISFWSKLTNISPTFSSIIEGVDATNARVVNIHAPFDFNAIVYWDCGGDRIQSSALTVAQRTGWHHYTCTKNATTGIMVVYLDNSTLISGTGKILSMIACTTVKIGSYYNNTNYYAGNVSLFSIYNRALSADEVSQNYNAQKSRFGL